MNGDVGRDENSSSSSMVKPRAYDDDHFEDCRVELRSHNLTSVLVNPRESMLEGIIEDFSQDGNNLMDMSAHSAYNDTTSSSGAVSRLMSEGGTTVDPTLPASTAISAATEAELQYIAERLIKAYRDSGFSHLVKTFRSLEMQNRGGLHGGQDDLTVCYRDVPSMFFRPDFSLRNPEMFNQVLGPSAKKDKDKDGSTGRPKALHQSKDGGTAPNKQEILSRYLDLVEVALLKQIWLKSTAFFRALDDIKGLQTSVASASGKISSLRSSLSSADEGIAMSAMKIPQLYRRRTNEQSLCLLLSQMQQVRKGTRAMEELLSMEDYVGALEVVSATKEIYISYLQEVSIMKDVGKYLEDYSGMICDVMCNKFVNACVSWDIDDNVDLQEDDHAEINSSKAKDIDVGESLGVYGNSKGSSEGFVEHLDQLVSSLISVEKLQSALLLYKSRLSEAVRLIVRTCVLEYLSVFDPTAAVELLEDSSSGSDMDTPFAVRVRGMSNENFLACVSMCFENLLQALHRADAVYSFIQSYLERAYGDNENDMIVSPPSLSRDNSSVIKPREVPKLSLDEQEVVLSLNKSCKTSCCELAQRSLTQLLSLRKDANAKLAVDKMKYLWEVSLSFVSSMENISGSTAYEVRQCLMVQTKYFLDHLHETFKGRLVNTLDNERWVQCDVSPSRQAGLDKLASGHAFLTKAAATTVTPGSDEGEDAETAETSSSTRRKDARCAVVEKNQFRVVWSVMLLVEITLSYLEVSSNFPAVTTDIIGKVVELFKLFDTRTNQLVLGAQAIQSAARLKNISAKHLSIAAQSVGLLLSVLPHVRAALLAQLPPKHHMLLTELDRISHGLIDHHNRLLSKFVGIVGDFVDSSASRLKAVDWDRFQGQSEYFEEVLKNVTALHRVIHATLPPEQVQDVFTRIFSLLNRKIVTHFEDIMPATQTGKQRILDEVQHLVSSFGMLKHLDCKGISLEESFQRRYMRNGGGSSGSSGVSNYGATVDKQG